MLNIFRVYSLKLRPRRLNKKVSCKIQMYILNSEYSEEWIDFNTF